MQGREAWNWGSSNLVMQRSLELLVFSEVMRAEGPTDGRVEGDEILDCGHHMAWLMKPATLDVITGSGVFTFWTNFVVQSLSHSRLCDPTDGSTPGFPVLHHLLELAQTHVHLLSDVIQASHPLLTPFHLPSIFPSIRIFSNELALPIRWPKYWNFGFSISHSNENSGLISFRIDWFHLPAVQGTLKSLL